jgi:Holliday junction resolvasome RuvABC endonuclease subunit
MNVIGVDLGIHKIHCAVFIESEDGFTLHRVCHHISESQTRSAQLWEVSRLLLDVSEMYDAHSVWIEETIIGNNRRYSLQLAQTMGACLAVLALVENKTAVHVVDNTVWKKLVIGNGHASKDQIKSYMHDTHPVYAAMCEDDQDAYDATCVGLYGLTILDRASSLSL